MMWAQQWKLRQRKWGGIYYYEVCPPEQSLHAQALLPWKWLDIAFGGKLSINLLFYFGSASGLCFCFIKLFLSWPVGFSPSCFYPWSCWGGSDKSGVIGHLTSAQGKSTSPHYSSTGSFSFCKSSHSAYIHESNVLHWGYYDFFYMRRTKMIQLPSSFSSVNHQSLCQLISWWGPYQTIRFLPIDFVSKATTVLTSQFPSIVGDLFFIIGWLYFNCIVLYKMLLIKFQS